MIIKRILLSISIITALTISQIASADSRNHRRGYGDYNHHYNHHRNHRYNSYYHNSRNWRHRNSFHLSYNNHYSHHRHNNLVGGLVLSSLLSYPRYSSNHYDTVVYKSTPVTHTRKVVYVDKPVYRNTTLVTSGRRLLRDLEGNCFERITSEAGDEIRVQLEAEECNF
jgi:hypothetical protein